jgi:hypothetical protein
MLLTTKYVDGLPLHRFETVLPARCRHPSPNLGALGDPVQRALPAAAESDARSAAGKSGDPLR